MLGLLVTRPQSWTVHLCEIIIVIPRFCCMGRLFNDNQPIPVTKLGLIILIAAHKMSFISLSLFQYVCTTILWVKQLNCHSFHSFHTFTYSCWFSLVRVSYIVIDEIYFINTSRFNYYCIGYLVIRIGVCLHWFICMVWVDLVKSLWVHNKQ